MTSISASILNQKAIICIDCACTCAGVNVSAEAAIIRVSAMPHICGLCIFIIMTLVLVLYSVVWVAILMSGLGVLSACPWLLSALGLLKPLRCISPHTIRLPMINLR